MTPDPTSLRSAREETIDALCRRFASDDLSMGELERRLEKARTARSREELRALLGDLQPKAPVAAAGAGPRARSRPARRSESVPEAATGAHHPTSTGDSSSPTSQLAFAIMGGTRRAGRWTPPQSLAAVAIMGGVELDFRDAVFASDVVEVNCFAFWGGVDITVPPDVNVDTRGFAVLGGFEQAADIDTDAGPDAPTIRITGMALMGGVDVKVAERGGPKHRRG